MILALVAVLGGIGLMVWAFLSNRREKEDSIDELLGMAPHMVPTTSDDAEMSALTGRAVELADQAADRIDSGGSLGSALERARISLRPGEFLIILGAGALGIAALVLVVTHSRIFAAIGVAIIPLFAVQFVRRRIKKRRRAFETQLPDALALIASSLSAGHTFLRAIQMMCEESGPPMSEEFARVVAETRLGDGTVDALARMSERLQIRDMDMVVQAIRIQQSVGGRLADLLHTLAEFIRARDEVRREVQILTAEGRMSAYVLAGLVPLLFLMIQLVNPDYVKPLYSGWGLVILGGCGASLVMGMFFILRMVKIEI
ncbi:MAG TPA: type II secretion system F family protein [Acidimicrobiales bacterium]|nr:type II secretion system F family protein [Acidimicrobiales bacterium]